MHMYASVKCISAVIPTQPSRPQVARQSTLAPPCCYVLPIGRGIVCGFLSWSFPHAAVRYFLSLSTHLPSHLGPDEIHEPFYHPFLSSPRDHPPLISRSEEEEERVARKG